MPGIAACDFGVIRILYVVAVVVAVIDVESVMAGVSPFSMSYAAVLYSGFNRLPGMLFVAYPANGRGSATLAPLSVLVYGLAEAF